MEESTKHVLQIAAVVGRSFNRRILELIDDTSNNLDLELSKLQQTGVISELTRNPELEYIFRQVLTQETIYNSILIKDRREYHRRVAEAILQLFPDRIDEFSTLLGHHFYNARDPRAFQYFQMNGDTAYRLYANVEAINYYGKAIEVAKWQENLQVEQVTELYIRRGRAYELDSQFRNALNCYEELEQMARKSGDKQVELKALIAQAQVYSLPSSEFNVELGSAIVDKSQKFAEELGDLGALAKLHWIDMNLNRFHQNLSDAQKAGEKAIALARELDLEELLAYSLNDTAHTYNFDAQVERAKELSLEAAELWEKLNNLPMLADSLAGLAAISVYIGNFDDAYAYSDRAYSISQNINNIWGQSYSRYAIGLVDLERGDISLAVEHFHQTLRDAKISKFTAGEVLARSFLSIVYSEVGDYMAAISILEEQKYPEVENLSFTRSLRFGAEVYSYARAGDIEKAEKIIEEHNIEIEGAFFIGRYYFNLGKCYLSLKKGDYQNVVTASNEFLSVLNDTGVNYLNPELFLIIGIASMEQGLMEAAKIKLEQGLQEAIHLNSRKTLWQLNFYLGLWYQKQGENDKAAVYFEQASEIIRYISDHIDDPSLKAKFLSKDEIQELQKMVQLAAVNP